MNEDDQHALTSLQREQTILQGRIKSLEDQRRLHEKLGYSRYYLDMQLRALRGELALCQYRLRQLERAVSSQQRPPRPARGDVPAGAEETGRHLLPVIGAFVVSLLALVSAGLLWYERFGEQPPVEVAPTATIVAVVPTATAIIVIPAPVIITEVHAVNKTEGLNVRSSAGTDAPVLRILARGAIVLLTGDEEDAGGRLWYQLKDDGWIAAEHVQVYATREEAEEAASEMER